MWSTRIISNDGLSRTADGFELDIRLPWYRSLPLSVLRGMALTVDDESVPGEAMRLRLEGREYALDDLEDRVDDWWHVRDSGFLVVRGRQLPPGDHKVDLTLTFEIPYVAGAVIPSNCVKTLHAA